MVGTKAGGIKAAATNKAKYGNEFYVRNGRKGGQNGHTGGFAANPELARIVGAKGGRKSKRGPAKNKKPVAQKEPVNKIVMVEPKEKKLTLRERLHLIIFGGGR